MLIYLKDIMNKIMLVLLVVGGIFVSFFMINCPPPGPWPLPPWCASGTGNLSESGPSNKSTQPPVAEERYISHYLPSAVDIYGRIAYYNAEDLPLSITILAWGKTIPSDNYNSFDWTRREQEKGAVCYSTVSLWNNDEWVNVSDLPPDMEGAYIVGFDNKPLSIQGKLYLNLLDPLFQQRIKKEMKAHVNAGTGGFVFDEITGTAYAVVEGKGPFDNYSLSGFSRYMQEYYPEKLSSLGISGDFNYKDFLVENNYIDNYSSGLWSNPAPLQKEYYYYLLNQTDKVINSLIDYALSLNHSIVIGANTNPLKKTDLTSFYDKLDLFVYEHPWFPKISISIPKSGIPSTPAIKYARSMGKVAAVMPMLDDMVGFSTQGRINLFRHQMAEVYASGGYYMFFPDINYAGVNYTTPHSSMYAYYNFVRNHPEAFANLTSVAKVAVVRPSVVLEEHNQDSNAVEGYSLSLLRNNIPFDVINISKIDNYKVVVVSGFTWQQNDINKLLSFMDKGGIVIASDPRFAGDYLDTLKGNKNFIFFENYLWWDIWSKGEDREFISEVRKYVNPVNAPDKVYVLPYDKAVHLLNYDFNGASFKEKDNFNITLHRQIENATLISPDFNATLPLNFSSGNGETNITIPSLRIWDVVLIKPKSV